MPGRDGRALKQLGDFGGDVVGTHEGFADEEGVHAVFPHRFDVGFVADAAFGHDDVAMAGFKDAIFIIRKEHRKAFDELMRDRAGKHLNIKYAFQELTDLPDGYTVPEGREKPWGTCHAVLSARKLIDGPFAVINADDYYGPDAFMKIYDFLSKSQEETAGGHGSSVGAAKPGDSEFRGRENEGRAENEYTFAMVGYKLSNTLTENGHVSRGICEVSSDGYLAGITERTKIMKKDGDIVFLGEELRDRKSVV